MADLSAVVNQLRINNEDERARDSNLNKNIAQSRVSTVRAMEGLARDIQFIMKESLDNTTIQINKNADKNTEDVNTATSKKLETDKDGRILLFANLAKQNEGIIKVFTGIKGLFVKNKGKEKADENRQNRFSNAITKGILGINKKFNGFVKSIADSAKEKGKNVLDILKKFAIVGALGALVAFLNSEMFKNMKETLIPALKTGLTATYDALVNLKDGLFGIMDGFTNEQGEFDFIAGIKNAIGVISEKFGALEIALGAAGLLLLLKPLKFFGKTAFMVGKGLFSVSLGAIRGSFGLLSSTLSSFGSALETTNTGMKDEVKRQKGKGGKLGKGKFGLLSRFGRLFGKVGLVGLAITGAASLMDVDLKNTKVFQKVGDAFKSMFSVVGDFTKSLLGIKKAASADLKKTVADADPDAKKKAPKRPEEIEAEKRKAAQNDAELKKKQAANLERMRVEKRKAQMDLFKKADADSMKAFKASQKAAKELAEKTAKEGAEKVGKEGAEAASKEAAQIIAKSATKSAIKKFPVVGLIGGLIFGLDRALKGDFVGAGLEVASGVSGTLPIFGTAAGFGFDGTLLAKDLGAFEGRQTANNGGGIDPIALRTGSAPIIVNNVNNSKTSMDNSQHTNTVTPIDDRGLHPSMLLVQ